MKKYEPNIMQAFSRAAPKNGELSAMDFLEAILRERPELRDQEVEVPRQGMMGNIIIIGDQVFKGPKKASPYSVERQVYNTEVETLRQLKKSGLPLKTSEIKYVGREAIFFCMDRIPGVPLYQTPDLNQEQKEELAKDIATFMLDMARAMPGNSAGIYAYSDDINGGNIMVDPVTKRLTGIIDFGDVYYGPVEEFESAIGRGKYDKAAGLDTGINDLVKQQLRARQGVLSRSVTQAKQEHLFSGLRA